VQLVSNLHPHSHHVASLLVGWLSAMMASTVDVFVNRFHGDVFLTSFALFATFQAL
jgi:hypothetical protein